MIVTWVPCYDHRPLRATQPEKDKLIVTWAGRTVAVDFSDESIVEYTLEPPVTDFIHKAWREDGKLHLTMPSFGNLKEPTTEDRGDGDGVPVDADWIRPKGKTQADIDAEKTAEAREAEKREAREYLQSTDHEVLKAVEVYLEAQKAIDATLLEDRRAARDTITVEVSK